MLRDPPILTRSRDCLQMRTTTRCCTRVRRPVLRRATRPTLSADGAGQCKLPHLAGHSPEEVAGTDQQICRIRSRGSLYGSSHGKAVDRAPDRPGCQPATPRADCVTFEAKIADSLWPGAPVSSIWRQAHRTVFTPCCRMQSLASRTSDPTTTIFGNGKDERVRVSSFTRRGFFYRYLKALTTARASMWGKHSCLRFG